MRILLIFILLLLFAFFFLKGSKIERSSVKPIFLRIDTIAENHQTDIEVKVHSMYEPDSMELKTLKEDYSNIWAHLNHLYATNDIIAGKEYYTENWFKQLAHHYVQPNAPLIQRKDTQHELHIQNWTTDGLVCTAIDSNLVFRYLFPDKSEKTTKADLAVVLLYQGDHWRIDAMRILNETSIHNLTNTSNTK